MDIKTFIKRNYSRILGEKLLQKTRKVFEIENASVEQSDNKYIVEMSYRQHNSR